MESNEAEVDNETITAWRACAAKYAETAFTGEGARRYGGRFNSEGTPLVYTSESLSLVTLELLARMNRRSRLVDFVCMPVTFYADHVLDGTSRLPSGWDARPYGSASQRFGDGWVNRQESLVLQVPSVVVLREHNYLINPCHPDANHLSIGDPEPLNPDPRIPQDQG